MLAVVMVCSSPCGMMYAQSKSKTKAKAKSKTTAPANTNVSSAELKKQQQSAQAEVKKTQEELKKNEAEVKRNLSELTRLEDDIAASMKESATLTSEVKRLNGKISDLEGKIGKLTQELERLRGEYLKAVKKMRVSRKRNSGMMYLFSAKDIAQAERRMRYLKEFSEWKDRQTKDIESKVAELSKANAALKQTKSDKDIMLGRELKVQTKLSDQKERQGVVVAELKANGEALKAHLAKKQSEVNALRNQVAAVIAEEQRKAEAERRKREEAAKAKAEQERIARQKEEAAKAEQKAREEAAKEQAARDEASKDKKTKEQPKKETPKKEQPKKEAPKKEETKKEPETKKDSKSKDYADARKRRPRDKGDKSKKETPQKDVKEKETPKKETPKQETPKPEKETPKSDSGFGNCKGSLPRPVSGSWRVTGKFGRHALPDLPDVIYDNPGIDVEVAKGATVKSVYGGEVSGVYMVPGFATVVIVNHGDYYTVYGNISGASVKVGDKVKQGQSLGSLAEDIDNPGKSSLHFEVWKGREKLNPQSWIQ